jgi:hypothetical protein
MLRYLIGAAAALGGAWLYHKKHTPAALTPARAAVHGALMAHETRPNKLEFMADMFGQEGLPEQAASLKLKAREVRKQAKGAQDLIERARACDQNAMGLIAAIREQALDGSPRAKVSCVLMARYCELNPMPELGPLGEMPVETDVAVGLDAQSAFEAAKAHGLIGSPFG